ncbi:MAG: Gfo/Idh/MocA family oxidoreductase [Planctomycetes bacterium]|nr:Gfo/Idh/MocA family oxidoreductase [Planctomycetota bacterium]
MTSLRAGLSGCGAAGLAAIAATRTHGHCDIVAAHDPDQAAAQALQRAAGVGTVTSRFEDLLATGVDFVVLTGPAEQRLEQVRLACEQAVPVLLHAPMAPGLADAAAMVAAGEAADVRLGVLVPDIGDPVAEQLRRMLVDGWFGALIAAHGFRGADAASRAPRSPADALLPLADDVHLVAWLTGRSCVQVQAQTMRGLRPTAVDSAVATARLRGEVQAVFATSHLSAGRSFCVRGTAGSVLWLGDTVVVRGSRGYDGATFGYDGAGAERIVAGAALREARARLAPALEGHGRFARWLDDRDGFPCPAEQALLDMRTLDAMQRALVSGATEPV